MGCGASRTPPFLADGDAVVSAGTMSRRGRNVAKVMQAAQPHAARPSHGPQSEGYSERRKQRQEKWRAAPPVAPTDFAASMMAAAPKNHGHDRFSEWDAPITTEPLCFEPEVLSSQHSQPQPAEQPP